MKAVITVKKRKTSGGISRLFFSISKNEIKKASTRNKLRRRIRVIMKKFLEKEVCGYTVIVRAGGEKLLFSELAEAIEKEIQ